MRQDAKTCDLSKGIEVNGDQITFHLSKADPEFLQQLALPFAFSSRPTRRPSTSTSRRPGTGPYKWAEYKPTSAMRVVRDPFFKEWSKDAQPAGLPDVIEQKFGLSVQAEVTQVENGQADWISNIDTIPADRLPELSRKYAKQLHVNPLLNTEYMALNTNVPPFDNEKARQAVNFATDRSAIVKIYGGPQLADADVPGAAAEPPRLPAVLPVHRPTRAAASGRRRTWPRPSSSSRSRARRHARQGQQRHDRRAQGGRRVLRRAAQQARLQGDAAVPSADIQYPYVQNSKNKVQIGWSDWFADYPAASDFLEILLGCDSFHPNSNSSPNIAQFCDKTVQGQMDKASSTALEDPNAANQLWAGVDKATTDKAPWVSLVNTKMLDFTSARVKGFQFSPQWYFLLAQASVK